MKVLFISAAFPTMRAGEADHALQLCLRLAERGETLQVLPPKAPFKIRQLQLLWP